MKKLILFTSLICLIGLTLSSCSSTRNCGGSYKSMGQGIHKK